MPLSRTSLSPREGSTGVRREGAGAMRTASRTRREGWGPPTEGDLAELADSGKLGCVERDLTSLFDREKYE